MSNRATGAGDGGRKGLALRLLGLVTSVERGEAATAALLTLAVAILLGGYYVIKPVREALILEGGGAEVKSYTGAVQAALFLFLVPLYGAYARKVKRFWLINGVTLFFASHLLAFSALGRAGVPVGVPFFVWVGIFNLVVIAQFWSFANDLYAVEQGRRLFPLIGVGSSLGAIAGSEIAGRLVRPLGVWGMMLVAAAMLAVSLALLDLVHRREGAASRGRPERPPAENLTGKGGFALVLRQRYLLAIALMTLTLNLVNTNGEYLLGKTLSQAAKQALAAGAAGGLSERELIAGYYADFQFWQNLVGVLLQVFVVSRILEHLGVRGALFVLPVIALGGYSVLAVAPLLAWVRLTKILENSADYSIQNTVRHALFLPTSRDAKYKAKQAVDTFFWRGGDLLSALAVFTLTGVLGLGLRGFAGLNVALVALWIVLAAAIAREHRRLVPGDAPAGDAGTAASPLHGISTAAGRHPAAPRGDLR